MGGTPGKISIYTRNTSSGTYSDFKELAMKKRDYAKGSQKMAGNEQIAAEVGKNKNGIGYVGLAYIKAAGIKVVPIDGTAPSAGTVRNKTYAYSRPTFYYTNGEPSGEAKAFVDFTLERQRPGHRQPGRLRAGEVMLDWSLGTGPARIAVFRAGPSTPDARRLRPSCAKTNSTFHDAASPNEPRRSREALLNRNRWRFLGLTLDELIKYFFNGNAIVAIVVLALITIFLFREGAGFLRAERAQPAHLSAGGPGVCRFHPRRRSRSTPRSTVRSTNCASRSSPS